MVLKQELEIKNCALHAKVEDSIGAYDYYVNTSQPEKSMSRLHATNKVIVIEELSNKRFLKFWPKISLLLEQD